MTVAAPARETAAPAPPPPAPGSPLNPAALGALLATAAAAWMGTGVFKGAFARPVGLLGAAIGVGGVWLAARTRRPLLLQFAVVPVAVLAGAVIALPVARGESLPSLVAEALREGGLSRPPVPFDPGWRLVTVVLFAALGAAALSLSLSARRPKLAVGLPAAVAVLAALLQPDDGALLSGGVTVALLVGALVSTFGGELAGEGIASRTFEVQRVGRAALAAVLLVGGMGAIDRAGFLFPATQSDPVIPPRRPEPQPPQPDRLLFTATAERPGPWRLGVLDVYDGEAWRYPPLDTGRAEGLGDGGEVRSVTAIDTRDGVQRAVFEITDLEGRVLPGVANPVEVDADVPVRVDPRTQDLRLPDDRLSPGLRYTVTSPLPPTGAALAAAGSPPDEVRPFLDVPVAPNEVAAILDEAPPDAWDRLQFVRTRFYREAVAAGAGDPVPVPPQRVAELLRGEEATPYELTAAEALLARWAGIPSRIGYGFYAGDDGGGPGVYDVHPRHGATWLEVYFDGQGWIPVVGVPPEARSTLLQNVRDPDPAVRPTDELALVVYVPILLSSETLFFVTVRWWLARALPAAAAAALVWWWLLPVGAKLVRGSLRRRRASTVPERIAAAYAELRDAARDLNVGHPSLTPLGFARAVGSDAEHAELAWLVTRMLWGDLARDPSPSDAEAAEAMARSVTSRLRRAQAFGSRMLAAGSRASLREPYTDEVPNLWPRWARRGVVRDALRRSARWVARPLRRLRPARAATLLLLVFVVLAGCARSSAPGAAPGLPQRIAPERLGEIEFRREPEAEAAYARAGDGSLVEDGRVYTVRRGPATEGSLQVAALRDTGRERELRRGVLDTIGTGNFELTRLEGERLWVQRLPEQRIYLWFSPGTTYYQLLVARRDFADAGRVFVDLLRHRRGEAPGGPTGARPFDPRRGDDL